MIFSARHLTAALPATALPQLAHAQSIGDTGTMIVTIPQNHVGNDDVNVPLNNDHHGVDGATFGGVFGD